MPDSLSLLSENVSELFADIYLSHFESEVGLSKESMFYSFTLVSFQKLALEIGGANGLAFVLNPSTTHGDRSDFPMTLHYSWPVIRHIINFDLANFNFSPQAFFNLFLGMMEISDQKILDGLINSFFEWPNLDDHSEEENDVEDVSPTEQFIDDFNTRLNPVTPLVLLSDEEDSEIVLNDLILQITNNGFDIIEITFLNYILSSELDTTLQQLEKFFSFFVENFTIENLKALIIPHISISLESLSLALEFPRTWLKPVDPDTNQPYEDENRKAMLRFNAGAVRFSTENGFAFENENSISFDKSEIGNTGLTVSFTSAKLNLSRTSTIPEAIAARCADKLHCKKNTIFLIEC